jgi:hypothetical protein
MNSETMYPSRDRKSSEKRPEDDTTIASLVIIKWPTVETLRDAGYARDVAIPQPAVQLKKGMRSHQPNPGHYFAAILHELQSILFVPALQNLSTPSFSQHPHGAEQAPVSPSVMLLMGHQAITAGSLIFVTV